nr:hypothetical protein [Tanacetum cinerariifolium]
LQIGIKSQGYREPGPEEDRVDYPANRGDNNDNESSDDDDNDDDVEKDEEVDEEEEHLAPVNPSLSPQVEDTEAFETNESASTPPTSPHHIIL